jgi:phosphoglycolate phosphatase
MPTVFFDLDGTLVDSSPGIVQSMQYALTSLGRTLPANHELESFIGAPLLDVFRKLLESENDRLPQKALQLYRHRYSRKGLFESHVYAEIPVMLTEIGNGGASLLVVTAKPSVFARIYGSELDGRRVDKTELIRYVLEQERLTPGKIWMVGDRHHDIIGAKANGLRSAGVLWGYGSREELSACKPDILVDTPAVLTEALARL